MPIALRAAVLPCYCWAMPVPDANLPTHNLIDLPSRLLYRDALMLILDKPAGLAVHSGSKNPRNAKGRIAKGREIRAADSDHLGLHLDSLRFGLPHPPELAHRLDRDTSGCLVLGRHRKALRRLGALFAEGKVEKRYWAIVAGAPPGDSGTIDKPLVKVGPAWNWQVRIDEKAGKPSITQWRLLGRTERFAWVECQPLTGRTHQIRVHLASIGCPILGDPVYGKATLELGYENLHLHARAISVPLYPGKPAITATAPPPGHMGQALAACGWAEEPESPKDLDR